MPNRLADEPSLYLRQHADNPVDWYPWGEEAFARARAEDKPILISVGYSACHWCHVMAHESFEDDYIARLMNEHFVCVKVDREERPDVDRIYMESVQMIHGHGGWPLNAFCFPDGRPFTGGTYFPPDERRGPGTMPWPQLLMRVSDYFQRNRDQLEENAANIVKNLELSNAPPGAADVGGAPGAGLTNAALVQAARRICEAHDDAFGGFGDAPKFPPSMTLDFLLGVRATAAVELGEPGLAARIDEVMRRTLTAMAHGGIYDQVGGGFARYSVDRRWLIPHFEKMLYDNGQLVEIYTKGFLRYRDPLYRAVVEETVAWLEREMFAPGGGFYAALDADTEGDEGATYVWRPGEVVAALGEEDGAAFNSAYGITPEGNFENARSNPALLATDFERREALRPLRERLLEARGKRPQPGCDTKRLTAWNSLVIRGLATAGFYLGQEGWIGLARRTADWIWEVLREGEDRLRTVAYDDGARLNGYLDDYAFYAEALLALGAVVDWVEPGASKLYLDRARTVADAITAHFDDTTGAPGCFFTSDDHERLVSRRKEWFDNALPSGNASLLHVCAGLAALTGEEAFRQRLTAMRAAYPGLATRAPSGGAHALSAFVGDATGTCVVKAAGDSAPIGALRDLLAEKPWRRTFVLADPDSDREPGYQLAVGGQDQGHFTDPAEVAARV